MTPHLRVVRGEPTPEELAALTAIVATARADVEAPTEPRQRGRWADPAYAHRRLWPVCAGGWRAALR